jgi:hypothetical protein
MYLNSNFMGLSLCVAFLLGCHQQPGQILSCFLRFLVSGIFKNNQMLFLSTVGKARKTCKVINVQFNVTFLSIIFTSTLNLADITWEFCMISMFVIIDV